MSDIESIHNTIADHIPKPHPWRMALFGIVILVAGVVIGAGSTLIFVPGEVMPAPPSVVGWMMGRLLEGMDRDLGLSAEQKEQLKPIFDANRQKFDRKHREQRAEMGELWNQFNTDISKVFTPEQSRKWEHKLEENQRRMRDDWARRGQGRGERGDRGPGRRRGPGDPNRVRRGPDDPNGPSRGPEQFGPDFGPSDSNRPPRDLDRGSVPERFRGERGPFVPGRRPEGPDRRDGDPNRIPMNPPPEGSPV
ncbi:MAG: hypothetical protein JW720_10095 [Sedimentisphaerales bacterium]|nr:hypothetical protein [Sedimentisphaerales bacterium]